MLFSNQLDKSVSHREDSTGAEDGEETQFTTQSTVIQSGSKQLVSLTMRFVTHNVEKTVLCFHGY